MKKNKNLILIAGAGLIAYFLLKKKAPETPETPTTPTIPTTPTTPTQIRKAFNKPQFAQIKRFAGKRAQVDGFIH